MNKLFIKCVNQYTVPLGRNGETTTKTNDGSTPNIDYIFIIVIVYDVSIDDPFPLLMYSDIQARALFIWKLIESQSILFEDDGT
jgi:hypothetical protein